MNKFYIGKLWEGLPPSQPPSSSWPKSSASFSLALSNTQFGFRKGRSTTAALGQSICKVVGG
ncbi:Hypothetical protein FKW44_018787 [Caligus rogercresseyi]|uniref:Uncharacterized protein n=1 Tax=Caligus rogercresseyi TaxID=217165 RepID=A0A7T8GUX1_CALRO|nr:Hypothetical protein FKW44_018787 [Caligus rogercresseyi]